MARADPTRLQQVLLDLIENAHKYSPEEAPTERTIKVVTGDANQLEIHYATAASSTIQTSFHATLTPEALAWCP